MITSFGFKNCTPFSSERPNVLRLIRHGKNHIFLDTSPLAVPSCHLVHTMSICNGFWKVLEQESFRNLISDCQVSLLTHLETDHSLMSSCGGRRWNILCNIASVLWRYTSTWTLRVALWCRCPSIIPLAGRLVSDHCLHTWVPTSAWDFPKLISPSLWVEIDYCLSPVLSCVVKTPVFQRRKYFPTSINQNVLIGLDWRLGRGESFVGSRRAN